jgi:hypothetical protein
VHQHGLAHALLDTAEPGDPPLVIDLIDVEPLSGEAVARRVLVAGLPDAD